MEPLERRSLLSGTPAITVNTSSDTHAVNAAISPDDSSGNISLRSAIEYLNATTQNEAITFNIAKVTSPIGLTLGEIEIAESMTISGPGRSALDINATDNGGNRIFLIDLIDANTNPVSVSVSGLSLSGGSAIGTNPPNEGGAIANSGILKLSSVTISGNTANGSGGGGAGIYNAGSLTMNDCVLSQNSTSNLGGGIYNTGTAEVAGTTFSNDTAGVGGGIYNAGKLTVADSTVLNNSTGGSGGGIFNDDIATLVDCTLLGNSALGDGGGIANGGSEDGAAGTLFVSGCTITGNSAKVGGGIWNNYNGTNITAELANTIVAGDTVSGTGSKDPDVQGIYATTDHDLIGAIGYATGFTDGTTGGAINGNIVGTTSSPIDPMLGQLRSNGGPTETMALLPGSAAIDSGDNTPPTPLTAPATDQRGFTRITTADPTIDIGAFELVRLTGSAATLTATEGEALSAPVATFTSPGLSALAADFTSTIDWGDGSATTGTISGTADTGFTVSGTHTYAEEISAAVVTVSVAGDASAGTFVGSIQVADADLSATALNIAGTEGLAVSGTVATAADADNEPSGAATDFTATIDWGDKSTLTTVTASQLPAGGVFSIAGSHTYAEEGVYTLSVTISDAGGASTVVHPTAAVSDAAINATAVPIAATEGIAFNGTVATFADADPAAASADYTATVDWGDKSALTTINGSAISASGGIFTVPASHAYAEEGTYTLSVAISDAGGATTTIAPVATVSDAAVTATAANVTATEGATLTATVATFTDADPAGAGVDYMATIDWGDKTSLTTIDGSSITASGGIFTLPASHAYAEEGTYTLSVAISDAGGATTTVAPTATVKDAALNGANTASATGGVEGVTAATLLGATFTDQNIGAPLTDFAVDAADWGDGDTSTAGLIVSGSAGNYTVGGSHLYAEDGVHNFKITVKDAGGNAATIIGTANIADAALSGSTAATASGSIEGVSPATLVGATFNDPNAGAPPNDFAIAAVDWGDGATSAAGLTISGSGGNYTVGGSHMYAEDGAHSFKVTVEDGGGNTATITGSANVADAALNGSTTATATGGIEGVSPATLADSTFADANAGAALNDFAITAVDWGDGGTSAAGLSISGGGGNYTIGGSHLYSDEGVHNFKITVKDAGGATATITGSANVADAALSATAGSINSTEAATFSGAVAAFTDADPAGVAVDYTATVDWGDKSAPTTIASSQLAAAGGEFTVPGSHVYAEEGTYTLSVVISDAGGAKTTVTPMATIDDAPLSGTGASVASGTGVSGPVASFSDLDTADTAADYAAAIEWGDGQTNTGNIATGATSGQFTVSGNHSYADNSKHTITVTVSHGSDEPLVLTSVEPGLTVNALGNFALAEDIYVIGSGTVNVSAGNGVLANDSGPGPLTVTAGPVTGANGGAFTFHTDGSFTYTPPSNFPGFDYVKYSAGDVQGDQATATVNVLSQTGGVVWKFYESVLGRDPDYGGLQYWINDFVKGGKTGDIAVGFFESDELLDKIIGGYYQQYLGRSLDQDGLNYWKGIWRATGGPEGIKAGFAASAEFNANAGNTADGWLTALYQRILNRAPDPQGFAYWKQQLGAGVPEKTIALGFFDSKEAYGNDVQGWFEEYLLRQPYDAELAQYVAQMQSGASDKVIEQEITNLPEYGANPPASPDGAAVRLPDYYPSSGGAQQQAAVARDAVFAAFGGSRSRF